jgi:RNA polymerase sigma-70 factor (ECF subfamily)
MIDHTMVSERPLQEWTAAQQFLEFPNQDTFAAVFTTFTPPLISFFRARGCDQPLSEDLAQDVMFIVYRKANQLRDRTLFRAWLFKVARSLLCRFYGKQSREIETIDIEKVADGLVASTTTPAATPAFEFLHWMSFLNSREREALTLRFIEDREYHEIASAKGIPIGTVQWRVFNAKRKLAPVLRRRENRDGRAA